MEACDLQLGISGLGQKVSAKSSSISLTSEDPSHSESEPGLTSILKKSRSVVAPKYYVYDVYTRVDPRFGG